MTIGRSATVRATDVPTSWTRASVSSSASRSRRIWVSSLRAWASTRRMGERAGCSARYRDRGRRGGGAGASGRDDQEHVLQRVLLVPDLEDAHAVVPEP